MDFKNFYKHKKQEQHQSDKKEQEELEEKNDLVETDFSKDNDNANYEEKQLSAEEVLTNVHNAAIVAEVKGSDETKDKIMEQAKRTIDQSIQEIDNKNTQKVQKAVYDANREACESYGIESSVPIWQVKLMKIGHSIWFVVYFIFASLTFCPINVFLKGIKSFVKNAWLAFLFAILCYLAIAIGIPFLLSLLRK